MRQVVNKNRFFLLADEVQEKDITPLFSADFWQKKGRILGFAQGRGKTYFIASKDLWGVDCALRHYYRGGFLGKINRDSYLFSKLAKTRSFAEFRLLDKLHKAGLAVPKPLGAQVIKSPLGFYRADLISEKIDQAQDLTAILQKQPLPEKTWQKIGYLIAQLHQRQICHIDLNAHNILLQKVNSPQEKAYLIDFDKCLERKGEAWKKENLARLKRSFLKEVQRMHIAFDEKAWQALEKGYAKIP